MTDGGTRPGAGGILFAMNAPAAPSHLLPTLALRPVPQGLLDALAQRFGPQCSTALAVREQHGRDEGSLQAPPPSAVVFAESTQDVQDAVRRTGAG